jgi:hypothetical protein
MDDHLGQFQERRLEMRPVLPQSRQHRARAATDVDHGGGARQVEHAGQRAPEGKPAGAKPAQEGGRVLRLRRREIVLGNRLAGADRLRGVEIGAPDLGDHLMRAADVARLAGHQHLGRLRPVAKAPVRHLEQTDMGQCIEQPR